MPVSRTKERLDTAKHTKQQIKQWQTFSAKGIKKRTTKEKNTRALEHEVNTASRKTGTLYENFKFQSVFSGHFLMALRWNISADFGIRHAVAFKTSSAVLARQLAFACVAASPLGIGNFMFRDRTFQVFF